MVLFLLSWLPIHLYRLITTYVPLIKNHFENSHTSISNLNPNKGNQSAQLNNLIAECKKNTTNKLCIYEAINKALANIKVLDDVKDTTSYSLHNRYVFFISYFMSMSSVCYNPIVYFWMHKKFRTEVKQIFSRVFRFGFQIRSRTNRLFGPTQSDSLKSSSKRSSYSRTR